VIKSEAGLEMALPLLLQALFMLAFFP